jgi:hypothetical protein
MSPRYEGKPNPGLADAVIEAAVEVTRLDGGAMPGGEDQPGADPGCPGAVTVGVLLLLAEL